MPTLARRPYSDTNQATTIIGNKNHVHLIESTSHVTDIDCERYIMHYELYQTPKNFRIKDSEMKKGFRLHTRKTLPLFDLDYD